MGNVSLVAALTASALLVGCAPVVENLRLAPAQWREDIRYFEEQLPARHPGAFSVTPKAAFDAAAAELATSVDRANADEIYVRLDQMTAGIGDAHTYVKFPLDRANLPIDVALFGTDYRVVAVATGMEKALGAKVIAINQVPVARVRELILPMTPRAELPTLRERRVADFMTVGMVLHGFGIVSERDVASFQLEDDQGQRFAVEVHSQPPDLPISWVHAYRTPPLFRTRPGETFWCETIAPQRALYCNLRLMRDLRGPSNELFERIESEQPERLILDLRQNEGGDYTEGESRLIAPIRKLPRINSRGHLFILVGTDTFSAAMNNAAQFRTETAAVLLGEPIGERPNSWQEVEEMTLPNSHLTVRYSTKFYTFMKNGENVVAPDETIVPTWPQYRAGEDPVLERALHWLPAIR